MNNNKDKIRYVTKKDKMTVLCIHGIFDFFCIKCLKGDTSFATKLSNISCHFCQQHKKLKYFCLECYKTNNINSCIKPTMIVNCNEWCFYISDKDEIKKLRCIKCKKKESTIHSIQVLKVNKVLQQENYDPCLDFLIDVMLQTDYNS